MKYNNIDGVPNFEEYIIDKKKNKYCLCIPIINEGTRIVKELEKAQKNNIHNLVDIIICDGGSTDGSTKIEKLKKLGVNTLLIKTGDGKQGAQLRMGFYWALKRGYEGIISIDGNNKDSIEDVPKFIEKLENGYDFVQGSRFIKGGKAINTPLSRYLAVKLLHAPIISITAGQKYTDTTNAYRAYSKKYLEHNEVDIFRDIFKGYELLAYLSVRADQLNLKTCEVPVTRAYPKKEKTPTKISPIKGNLNLFKVLINNMLGKYTSKKEFRTNIFALMIFVLVLIVQLLFYSKLVSAQMTNDSYNYVSLTINSLLTEGVDKLRVPLYPIIIDICRQLTTNYKILICILQIILFYISSIFMYLIMKKINKNKIFNLLIVLIYSCAPYVLVYNQAILTESFSLSLITIWIYQTLKVLETNSNKRFLAISIEAFILIMLKPVFLYLLVILIAYPIILKIKKMEFKRKILIAFIPIVLTLMYALAFYNKYEIFTISATSINQKFIISIQRKYYEYDPNNEISKIIIDNKERNEWEILSEVYASNYSLKQINEYNHLVFKNNANKVPHDTLDLMYKISDQKYLGDYYTIKDKYNYDQENYVYKSKFVGIMFSIYDLKIMNIYVLIVIALFINIVKLIKTKRLPIIDLLLLGMIAMPLIIAILSTNAEYPRTSCLLLPAAFIYFSIILYYVTNKTLKLPIEEKIIAYKNEQEEEK